MHIGGVAKEIGLTPDAIRFYERSALLPRLPRTVGGFRRYDESDLEALRFIRRVQALGFTLSEVREFLELRHGRTQPCAPVRQRLQQKLSHVREKLADLHKLEHELSAALRSCNRGLRKPSARCPLLSSTDTRKPGSSR